MQRTKHMGDSLPGRETFVPMVARIDGNDGELGIGETRRRAGCEVESFFKDWREAWERTVETPIEESMRRIVNAPRGMILHRIRSDIRRQYILVAGCAVDLSRIRVSTQIYNHHIT